MESPNYYEIIDTARLLGATIVDVFVRRNQGRRRNIYLVRIYMGGEGWRKWFWLAHGDGSWKVGLMSARTYEFASADRVLPFLNECAGPKWSFFTSSLPEELMQLAGLTQIEWQPDVGHPRPPKQTEKRKLQSDGEH